MKKKIVLQEISVWQYVTYKKGKLHSTGSHMPTVHLHTLHFEAHTSKIVSRFDLLIGRNLQYPTINLKPLSQQFATCDKLPNVPL